MPHDHIAFTVDLTRAPISLWLHLGEARSKCEHLRGAPLMPATAEQLYQVTMIKGALATTAIEGNTLTFDEAQGIARGTFQAPPSRQYQEQELRNVIEALLWLADDVMKHGDGEEPQLSPALLRSMNLRILNQTDLEKDVTPGEFRSHSVAVGNYLAPPAEDVETLVTEMCDFLEGDSFRSDDPDLRFAFCILRAVVAHLYLAWIHPFGDGNGRVARLVEFLLLARSGVPFPAAHLLSNHYNLTRDRYYRMLDRASKDPEHGLTGFISYAVEGLVDQLRDAIDLVRDQQIDVTWVSFVHEAMSTEPNTAATKRQRTLVLSMPPDVWTPRTELTGLTPDVAAMYAVAGPRTLSRDLNKLVELGLIETSRKSFRPAIGRVKAFLPPFVESTEVSTDGPLRR